MTEAECGDVFQVLFGFTECSGLDAALRLCGLCVHAPVYGNAVSKLFVIVCVRARARFRVGETKYTPM